LKNDLSEKEKVDIDHWTKDPMESPESDSVHNIINKVTDMPSFLESLEPYSRLFDGFGDVLELGGGQGWASCLLKRLHPAARYTVTDISEHAVASVPKWERILGARIDKAFAAKSYEIPVPDESYDCIFTYASAHHFAAHRRSMVEFRRVLKPGGHVLYFHEPVCRKWIYKAAYRRVNKLRPVVEEDVIVYPKLLEIAREEGFRADFRFTPTLHKRRPKEFLYFFGLSRLPFLQHLLPATATFHFIKGRD
jgi:SAM-dependent methyltransferase